MIQQRITLKSIKSNLRYSILMSLTTEGKFTKFMRSKFEEVAQEEYLTMSDGTLIRVLQSSAPQETKTSFTVMFMSGWGSVVQGWDDVLMEATHYFDIVYMESREKGSCKHVKNSRNDLDRLSSDIREIIEQLKLKKEELILFSSSFGALQAAHGLAYDKYEAFLTLLIGVSPKIELPFLTRYLIPWGPPIFLTIFKPVSRFWIKRSKSEDAEQAAKYLRVLEEADARKWKSVAKHVVFSKFWDVYEKVDNPVLIIGMEKDKYHEIKHIKKIATLMKNSTYLDMETNKKTHSSAMIDMLREQVNKIKKI